MANWLFELAYAISQISPRGKGAIPRFIGRVAKPFIRDVFVTRHGGLLPLAPEFLDVYVAMRKQGNSYDYWVFRVANAMLEDGGVFYDVGANVGYMSVEIAHLRRKNNVTVYAFEPHQGLAKSIEDAIVLNEFRNVTVDNAALTNYSGSLGFAESKNSFTSAVAHSNSVTNYTVSAICVDDLVYIKGYKPPDVIKIDVEGYEFAVLSGAIKVLQVYRPTVIFEISPGMKNYNYSPKLLNDLFQKLRDYRFYTVKGKPLNLRSIIDLTDSHFDVLAIPKKREARYQWFLHKLKSGEIDKVWN